MEGAGAQDNRVILAQALQNLTEATRAQLDFQQQRQAHPRSKPLPTFQFRNEKGENWFEFKQLFETTVNFLRYDDQEARRALKYCMRGAAAQAVNDILPDDANLTIAQMVQAYEARFVPAAASDLMISEFESAVQESKESILQFHGRLQTLWQRAFPQQANVAANLPTLIRKFALGIRKETIRMQVLRAQPVTYAAALTAAQNEAAAQALNKSVSANYVLSGSTRTDEPMEVDAVNALKTMKKSSNPGSGSDKGKVTCFHCQKPGHMRKDCRKFAYDKKKGLASPSKKSASGPKKNKQEKRFSKFNKFFRKAVSALDEDNEDEDSESESDEDEDESPGQSESDDQENEAEKSKHFQ